MGNLESFGEWKGATKSQCRQRRVLRGAGLGWMEESKIPMTLRAVMVGASSVGKSSLCHRFGGMTARELAGELVPPTIGVDFVCHPLSLAVEADGRASTIEPCILQLIDTAGQERFRATTPAYLRGSHVYALVFDLTNRHSWDELWQYWWSEVRNHLRPGQLSNRQAVAIVIGNKFDLVEPDRAPRPVGIPAASLPGFSSSFGTSASGPGLGTAHATSKLLGLLRPPPPVVAVEGEGGQSVVESLTDEDNELELGNRDPTIIYEPFVGQTPHARCVTSAEAREMCAVQGISYYFETSARARRCDILEMLTAAVGRLDPGLLRSRRVSNINLHQQMGIPVIPRPGGIGSPVTSSSSSAQEPRVGCC